MAARFADPEAAARRASLDSVQEELSRRARDSKLATRMIALLQEIDAAVESGRGKVVQFLAASPGEGTSTVVRELARVAGSDLGRDVLVLRADGELDEAAEGSGVPDAAGHPGEERAYAVSSLDVGGALHSLAAGSGTLESYFDGLRDRFDLTLVDSPPARESQDAVAVTALADGVVLVVEGDRATWTSGKGLKQQVLQAGGRILGVVLNKRTEHVPAIVRRYL